MKMINVRDLQKRVKACVKAAQRDHVVITRRGQPAAILVGVDGMDWESIVLGMSGSFWRMIAKRRGQKTISLADIRRRLKA